MRFAPTDDQIDLASALRVALVDSAVSGGSARVFAQMGLAGLLLPESVGGAEADESMLVTLLTEAGYAAVSGPLVDTVAFAPSLLLAAGLDEVAAGVARGDLWCAADLQRSNVVPAVAGVVLTSAVDGAIEIRPVEAGKGEPVAAVDPRAGLVRLGAGAGTVIGRCEDAAAIDRARLRASVGAAAQLVGLARRMLDLTTGYVKERHQFGVPVGSFQAVKHHLADVALAVEFAAPVVASAAAMLADNLSRVGNARRSEVAGTDAKCPLELGAGDVSAEVSAAKVLASEAALLAARKAIQCHGAIGYTTEYHLHLWVKQAWALAAAWGSADDHRRIVADHLGLP